jgi:hypothetical protein
MEQKCINIGKKIMCPVCYFPLFVAILSALGLTSTHIWIDENPFISGVGVGVGSIALTWGIYKLYKYFTKPKECGMKK